MPAQDFLEKEGLDALLLLNSGSRNENFFRHSGLPWGTFENSLLLLRPHRKSLLFCSSLELAWAKKQGQLAAREMQKSTPKTLAKILRRKKVGFDEKALPVDSLKSWRKAFPKARLQEASGALARYRDIKEKEEMRKIQAAVRLTEELKEEIPRLLRPEMTESRLARKIESSALSLGAQEMSFPTIVAHGKNAGIPHHVPGPTKIGKGILLVDVGIRLGNYCSDLTWMYRKGKVERKAQEAFMAVQEGKKAALEAMRAGQQGKAPYMAAEKTFHKHGFRQVHGLGHGLGLAVHDFPKGMNAQAEWKIREGMVLTVEPGVYGKWGGIRMEDDIVMGKKKPRLLSRPQEEWLRL